MRDGRPPRDLRKWSVATGDARYSSVAPSPPRHAPVVQRRLNALTLAVAIPAAFDLARIGSRRSRQRCGHPRSTATTATYGSTCCHSSDRYRCAASMAACSMPCTPSCWRTASNPTGAGGLSPRSVRYVHTIVHRAFRDAVRWGRITRNPADGADPPRAAATARPAMNTWSANQVRAFLDYTTDHRLHAAFVVLATTGMRRGECLGLRWSDLLGGQPVGDRADCDRGQPRGADRITEDCTGPAYGRLGSGHNCCAASA